jgi:glutathione S-transferase
MRLYDYSASANCYKARLLLALLDRPYERVPVDIFGGDTLTDEYAARNPLRETPVLELDNGELVAQSNAILWYLGEETAYLPDDRLVRARIVQWLSFEQEWIMSGVGGTRFRRVTERGDVPWLYARGEKGLRVLDAHLAGRRFVVGERCSIADVSLFAYAHVAPDAGYDLGAYPAVTAWLDAVRAEPGFMHDLAPYPDNARPGASRSIYDKP